MPISVGSVTTGSYVTATATDAAGNTSEFARNSLVGAGSLPAPTATSLPTNQNAYASDHFGRSVAAGWGRAEIGGVYAAYSPSSNLMVQDVGTLSITRTNSTVGAYLTDVSALDTDMLVQVKTDQLVVTSTAYVLLAARRVSGGTEYRGRLGLSPNGTITLMASRVLNNVDDYASLGAEVNVTSLNGLRYTASSFLWLRMQVMGSNPTTVRLRVWSGALDSEPTTWHYTSNPNSETSLQAAGSVGLRAYYSGSGSMLPSTAHIAFDDLCVTDGSAQAVCPAAVATPTATTTQTATPTETHTATQTATTPMMTATATSATETPPVAATSTPEASVSPTATVTQPGNVYQVFLPIVMLP